MFLEHQISILEWLLRDHVTLKTGVMAADFQLCYHRNKSCCKKLIKKSKKVILNCNITHFLYKKIKNLYSLSEYETFQKKKLKKVMNQHHMPWQLSEVKVQTVGIQSEKIWTPYRQSTHPHSFQLKWSQCSIFYLLICWIVYALPYCLIEQIQHDRTSLYMILSFQNDSVHKNINPNKGAAEYFGDFSV